MFNNISFRTDVTYPLISENKHFYAPINVVGVSMYHVT